MPAVEDAASPTERFTQAARSVHSERDSGLWDSFVLPGTEEDHIGDLSANDNDLPGAGDPLTGTYAANDYQNSRHPYGFGLLGTFSIEVTRYARKAHRWLQRSARLVDAARNLTGTPRPAIELYALNSVPFHRETRNNPMDKWEPWVAPMTQEQFDHNFAGTSGQRTVAELSRELQAMPPVPGSYDVAMWTRDYKGRMCFRSAQCTRLTFQGGDGGPVYRPPRYENHPDYPTGQQNIVTVGDYVTNTDFLSTSAHPTVPGNFGPRQVETLPDGKKRARIDTWKNLVFFEIDFLDGKNITAHTAEEQAEILFDRDKVFEVTGIHVNHGTGLLVQLQQVHEPPLGKSVRNIMTGIISR